MHINVVDDRKPLYKQISEKDINKLQVNDSGDNEGTICLVNK